MQNKKKIFYKKLMRFIDFLYGRSLYYMISGKSD